MTKVSRPLRTAILVALLVLATVYLSQPAKADFFDDARKTFQTDIPHFFTQDAPHFFQDDIPCAFGGHPTSGARKACATNGPSEGETTKPKEPPPKNSTGKDPPGTGQQ